MIHGSPDVGFEEQDEAGVGRDSLCCYLLGVDPFLSRTVTLLVGFFFASFFGQMTV